MDSYKKKYEELKIEYLRSADVHYRLGYADGLKDSQLKQLQMQAEQQQAMMQQQAQMQAQGQIDPATGQPIQDPSQMPPEAQMQMEQQQAMGMDGQEAVPSELDGKIQELAELVSKGEKIAVIKAKSLEIENLRKTYHDKVKTKAEKLVNDQQKLVSSILSKWEKQATDTIKGSNDEIEKLIKEKGLKL